MNANANADKSDAFDTPPAPGRPDPAASGDGRDSGGGGSVGCGFSPLLSPYHDGELAGPHRHAVEEHLKRCRSCAAELEDLRGLSDVFADTREQARIPRQPSPATLRLSAPAVPPAPPKEFGHLKLVRRLTALAALVFVFAAGRLAYEYHRDGRDGSRPLPNRTILDQDDPSSVPGHSRNERDEVVKPAPERVD